MTGTQCACVRASKLTRGYFHLPQAQEVHRRIRAFVASCATPAVARSLRIIYGGSVKAKNCTSLIAQPDIDGVLHTGTASLIHLPLITLTSATISPPPTHQASWLVVPHCKPSSLTSSSVCQLALRCVCCLCLVGATTHLTVCVMLSAQSKRRRPGSRL